MAESDDDVRRAYRQLATEEPSALIDAAILAQARKRRPSRFGQWAGPVSIAAVLVLGIGVSLRMQLEEPGVETSVPSSSADYPLPQSAAPAAEPPVAAQDAPKAAPPPPAKAKVQKEEASLRRDAATVPEVKEQVPASPPAFVPDAPASAPAPAAPSPAQRIQAAPAELGAAAAPQARAKREGMQDSAAGARELRKSLNVGEAEIDPARELERIAKLREAGQHADADKALEEFRKRHPDFRIPEAMWERVKPR